MLDVERLTGGRLTGDTSFYDILKYENTFDVCISFSSFFSVRPIRFDQRNRLDGHARSRGGRKTMVEIRMA